MCERRALFSYYYIATLIIITAPFSICFAQSVTFDADNAYDLLVRQCDFGPRNPGSAAHELCAEWFIEYLGSLTDEVRVQNFQAVEGLTGKKHSLKNIIARFPGTGNNTTLMLCAHWDTRSYADLDPDPANRTTPIAGANDGASGVAVLLEIAGILSDNPPPFSVLITLFDGEDMGKSHYAEEFALGSAYWASHQIPEPVDKAILLDMIGDEDLEIPIERFSEMNSPNLTYHLWNLAEEMELTAFSNRLGPGVSDDHVPLQKVGIEAVDLIDFNYKYWHTIEDTPDKCAPESLNQVGRLLVAYIYGR